MGVDFLKSKAKVFNKGWDNSRLKLIRKGLFTREPDCLATGAVARMLGPRPLAVGEEVFVRTDGERLVVVQDLSVRAEFVRPPESIVRGIRESGGYAKGRIAASFPSLQLVEVLIQ